jgi:hypothetical protein
MLVGMLQRRHGVSFAFETLTELRLGDFDGDDAIKACVASLVHLTHATRADRRNNFERAESVAGLKRHISESAQFS